MTHAVRTMTGALEQARKASLFILDIDGVLLDPKPSFYTAASETAAWAASRALGRAIEPAITDADIHAFKSVGGWNDDFDLACACTWGLIVREAGAPRRPIAEMALQVGGGLHVLDRFVREALPHAVWAQAAGACSTELIRQRAAVRYAGRARCLDMYGIEAGTFPDLPADGLWAGEPLLCRPESLQLLGGPFAIFTGRNRAEAEMALERLDLFVAPEWRAVDDGQTPRKPAPDALVHFASRTAGPVVFIGDSIDDERAVLAYEALGRLRALPEFVFVRIIGETDPDRSDSLASIIAPSLDAFAQALRPPAGEELP